MKYFGRLAACLVALFAWSGDAIAQINVMGNFRIDFYITVRNATSTDVEFKRTTAVCTVNPPDSFIAKANSDTTILVQQKYWDTGLDNCFAKYHNTVYSVANNPYAFIQIQQHLSSNNYACINLKEFIIFWINYAICPQTGVLPQIVTAGTKNYNLYCPGNVPYCPPAVGSSQVKFGFLITGPIAGAAPPRPKRRK